MKESKYDPEYHPAKLLEYMQRGLLDVEIFAIFGISKTTFYRWLRDYKELKESYEIGLPASETVNMIQPLKKMVKEGNEKGLKALNVLARNKYQYDQSVPQMVHNTQINVKSLQVISNKEEYLKLQEDVKETLKELNLLESVALPKPEDE